MPRGWSGDERRCGTLRLGVSLETHAKIWYQKLKLKLNYEQLKTHKTYQVNPCAHMVANLVSKRDPKIARNSRKSLGKSRFSQPKNPIFFAQNLIFFNGFPISEKSKKIFFNGFLISSTAFRFLQRLSAFFNGFLLTNYSYLE